MFNSTYHQVTYVPKYQKFDKATEQQCYEEWHKNKFKKCNCRSKDNCPLDKKILAEYIIYEGTVSATSQTNTYFGSAEGNFKGRYNNHALSFRSKGYKHRTELSKYIWFLEDRNTEFSLK